MAAAADLADHGRAWRAPTEVEAATAAGTRLMDQARLLADKRTPGGASTPSVKAAIATAEAEWTRLVSPSDAAAWLAAAEDWAEIPMPYHAARARARAGEAMLLVRAPREEAALHLRAAHAAAIELGAVPLRESIEAIATRARIDLQSVAVPTTPEPAAAGDAKTATPARTPAEILGLSSREWEVLELVAAGRSNAEIAGELFISPKTASVPVTHILDKLGVSNRVEAATIAVRVGAGSGTDQREKA
jgi:DNA-binding NarL/FixJ family response regulator